MTSEEEKQDVLFRLITSLAHQYCYERTVAIGIVDRHGKPYKNGSGVCIKIGDRYFIATVAHILSEAASKERLFIVSSQRPDKKSLLQLNIKEAIREDALDLGLVEIEENVANFTGKVFITLEDCIIESEAANVEDPWFALGFPSNWVGIQNSHNDVDVVRMIAMGFTTNIQKSKEREYLYLDYPTQNVLKSSDGSKVELPDAYGLSGGGFWAIRMNETFQEKKLSGVGGFWSPLDIRLNAIDCSWHQNERYIKAIRIENWLEFVSRNYLDCKEEISAKLTTSD